MDRLGSFQFDPLGVAGRNHDLVLHARIAGYRPAWTEELLYEHRVLFENVNKALCILPTSELPYYRISWDRSRSLYAGQTLATNAEATERILARIRAEGPLSTLDFERGPAIDWYWGPTNQTRAILEALWNSGVIGVARRDGNRRYYDLVERLYPADVLAARVTEDEQLRHKMLSRPPGQRPARDGRQRRALVRRHAARRAGQAHRDARSQGDPGRTALGWLAHPRRRRGHPRASVRDRPLAA